MEDKDAIQSTAAMGKTPKSMDAPSDGAPSSSHEKKKKKKKKRSSKNEETSVDRPTILCWLMERTKYEDAMERLHDAPEEASTWIVDHASDSKALPLHLACRQLKIEKDQRQRIVLCDLISHLLLVNPSAAEKKDGPDGRLAIHDAVAGGIDEETLALLLTVYPDSINTPDERRLNLTEINRLNTNDPDIQSVIDLGYDEWKMAYDASPLASGVSLSRMDDLMSVASAASRGTLVTTDRKSDYEDEGDAEDGAANYHPEDSTDDDYDSSISSLDSEEDDTHVDTAGGMATAEIDDDEDSQEEQEIPIVSWERVQERALGLEKILADMKEENYTLHEKIQQLSNDQGLKIILQVDRNQGTDLYSMVDVLQHQNFALDQNIYKTETLLHYSVFPSDDESVGRQRRRGEVAQMLGWLDEDEDADAGETLQQIHDELKGSYDQQKAAIEQFGFVFDLIGDKSDDEDDDNMQRSVVSNLTMNDDDWSLNSNDDASRPARSSGVQVEIEWPEDKIDACAVSDNLSTIFRHASGVEEDENEFQEDSAMDNLSQILQTAAAKDKRRKKVIEANKDVKKKKKKGKKSNPAESQELAIPALMANGAPASVQVSKQSDSQASSKPSFFDNKNIFEPGMGSEAKSKRSLKSEQSSHTASSGSNGSRELFRKNKGRSMDKVNAASDLGRAAQRERNDAGVRRVDSAEFDYYAEYQDVSSSPKAPSMVNFGTVSVRVFDRIISDNPGCSNGPSLGIGWIFVPQDDRSVNDYEALRVDERMPEDLLLTRDQRESILRSLGYTNKEIAAGIREINKTRAQRRQTIVNLGAQKLEEKVESARKTVKNIITLGRRKKNLVALNSSSTHSTSSLTKDKSEQGSNGTPQSSLKSSFKPPVKSVGAGPEQPTRNKLPFVRRGSLGGASKRSDASKSKRSF